LGLVLETLAVVFEPPRERPLRVGRLEGFRRLGLGRVEPGREEQRLARLRDFAREKLRARRPALELHGGRRDARSRGAAHRVTRWFARLSTPHGTARRSAPHETNADDAAAPRLS